MRPSCPRRADVGGCARVGRSCTRRSRSARARSRRRCRCGSGSDAMKIGPGTHVGIYEITASLGSGAMGNVYRARDPRLERDVAIKALPDGVANDPDALARFEREARFLASLNHPNIAAIYGIEEAEGERLLVLELVPGETLEERLHRGPIPLPQVLDIGVQIASALEAAHEADIVHRDLKPSNV